MFQRQETLSSYVGYTEHRMFFVEPHIKQVVTVYPTIAATEQKNYHKLQGISSEPFSMFWSVVTKNNDTIPALRSKKILIGRMSIAYTGTIINA